MVGVDRPVCMAYNSISIKPYIKSHLELQREITLIELAPSPYFFVLSICLAYMDMFARFDENPAMTKILRKQRYGWTQQYEGWSKSSDRCLVALSRDIFERHTMHHSKDLVFTFMVMLMVSRCTVSINSYSTLYMVHSIPLAFIIL